MNDSILIIKNEQSNKLDPRLFCICCSYNAICKEFEKAEFDRSCRKSGSTIGDKPAQEIIWTIPGKYLSLKNQSTNLWRHSVFLVSRWLYSKRGGWYKRTNIGGSNNRYLSTIDFSNVLFLGLIKVRSKQNYLKLWKYNLEVPTLWFL